MTTFALVHGAWHDAWCWNRLTPELQSLGHDVVAVDLPCEDPSATFETYAEVVVDAVDHLGDDLVVVGHSLGGNTIPLVAARRPVRHLVFLCALIPEPGRSLFEQLTSGDGMLVPGYERGLDGDAQSTWWIDRELATDRMYADCSPEDVRDALARLRPQSLASYKVPFRLDLMPDAERSYIVCAEDRLVDPAWSRVAARERLGVDAIELPGSHSPFLSRPKDLARVLHTLA